MTAADRQRRYRERQRRHADGDHSWCVAGRCPEVEPGLPVQSEPEAVDGAGDVTCDVTPTPENPVTHLPPPAGLRDRGLDLWRQMSGLGFGPGHLVLLAEACRVADTLERLNSQLDGGDWLDLVRAEADEDESVTEIRVTVNGLLAERRQQQTVFRLAIAELRQVGKVAGDKPAEPAAPPAGEGGGDGDVADLTAWIDAARRAAPEG